jgi:hypothetical protein
LDPLTIDPTTTARPQLRRLHQSTLLGTPNKQVIKLDILFPTSRAFLLVLPITEYPLLSLLCGFEDGDQLGPVRVSPSPSTAARSIQAPVFGRSPGKPSASPFIDFVRCSVRLSVNAAIESSAIEWQAMSPFARIKVVHGCSLETTKDFQNSQTHSLSLTPLSLPPNEHHIQHNPLDSQHDDGPYRLGQCLRLKRVFERDILAPSHQARV